MSETIIYEIINSKHILELQVEGGDFYIILVDNKPVLQVLERTEEAAIKYYNMVKQELKKKKKEAIEGKAP